MTVQDRVCGRIPDHRIDPVEDTAAFSFFIFEQCFKPIRGYTHLLQIALADGRDPPGTFDRGCQGIDLTIPFQQPPLPAVPGGDIDALVPTHGTLILSVVNGQHHRHGGQFPVGETMLHHKGDQPRVMIVYMHDIRLMSPV